LGCFIEDEEIKRDLDIYLDQVNDIQKN
jgi:hypothetical protein